MRTRSYDRLTPAAAGADEVGVRVVARGFAGIGFGFGLLLGDALSDEFDDLFFGEAGIFQAADGGGANGRESLQFALQNRVDRGIRETDQTEHDGVAADGIELVGLRVGNDVGFGVTCVQKVRDRVCAAESAFVVVCGRDQGDASFVADAGALEAHKLLELGIGNVEGLKAIDGSGVHAGLVERAIIHQGVLVAAHRKGEDPRAEHEMRALHNLILGGLARPSAERQGQLCLGRTRPKGQVAGDS